MLQILLNKIAVLRARLALITAPKTVHPIVEKKARLILAEMTQRGYHTTIFQGYRPIEEQNRLYAQGRTTPGAIVTNAKGGQSLHNYGVAVDIVFVENGRPSWAAHHPWQLLGEIGKSYGFEWGGDWKSFQDRPHFQYTKGYTLADFQNNKVNYNNIT